MVPLIVKRVFAIALRSAFLVVVFLGLSFLEGLSESFTVFSQPLVYVGLGALLIIGFWFRKQTAVLLILLFLAIVLPLHFPFVLPVAVDFDLGTITNGIVILLALNLSLIGLFQEGQMRPGTLLSLALMVALETFSMFAASHYVGTGAIAIKDEEITLNQLPLQIGSLSPGVSLIFLVCLTGSVMKELIAGGAFASLTVDILVSLGIYNYLAPHMGVSSDALFLIWTMLMAVSIFKQIYQVSYIDQLTGIPSRRALHEQAMSLSGNYIVAMGDIDYFKKFNDRYGHDVGDEVLAFVASMLSKQVRGSVFRYGGEEFTMLFRKGSFDEIIRHLDEVREQVAKTKFRVRSSTPKKGNTPSELSVTISIGVAERSDKHSSFGEVIKAADKALYRAKKKGRNCVSK